MDANSEISTRKKVWTKQTFGVLGIYIPVFWKNIMVWRTFANLGHVLKAMSHCTKIMFLPYTASLRSRNSPTCFKYMIPFNDKGLGHKHYHQTVNTTNKIRTIGNLINGVNYSRHSSDRGAGVKLWTIWVKVWGMLGLKHNKDKHNTLES